MPATEEEQPRDEETARAIEALNAALAPLAESGARVEKAVFVPSTGLLALSLFGEGSRKWLGVGVGPESAGLGWIARAPEAGKAAPSHPLVTALRAHVLEHRVRSLLVDDEGTLWISVGGAGAIARLALKPARQGSAQVLSVEGRSILQYPSASLEHETSSDFSRLRRSAEDLVAAGTALLEGSERSVARRAKVELARAVKTRAQSASRRADAVRGDLARLGDVGRLQKLGRLLIAQGDAVPKGASKATLEDWEEGGEIEVPLDPARPAKAQAEGFFAKARRLQRGEKVMRARLDDAERTALALNELARAVAATAEHVKALEALVPRARSLGVPIADALATLLRGGDGGAGRGKNEPREGGRRPYHKHRDARGRVILVGRGGRDNDALLTNHARPHDLWLHAKGVQGAHVVVPLEKNTSCPPELLVDAATLASHFSDARGEAVCEVSYVERRYVRKPKGSAPGFVTFEREKVLTLRVEPERVERLLAARDES